MTGESISLYCLPYAGGNAFFYRPFEKLLAPGIRFCPLELPGRGRRSREALGVSMDELVDDVFSQTVAGRGRYALMGHSMGAILAYLCALKLRDEHKAMPEALFLSGCAAPMSFRAGTCHLLPRAQFFEMLSELGGCPPEVLNEPELLAYFEPILRADFQALGTWQPKIEKPLDLPLVVLGGRQDRVGLEKFAAWKSETRADFELHEFDGGHFYIQKYWREIAEIISERLSRAA